MQLAALRESAPARIESMPTVRAGFDNLQGFELAQRAAKALAASTLVPKEFQGNIANSMIALELAQRIGASPLMVMQHLYIVHGRPGWSAVFMIASFNQCGRFTAIRYEWSGKEGADDWGCKAYASEKSTGERIDGPLITIGLAKREGWYSKNGSKWQTMPQLMLMYRAASWLVRTHAPEISMGLQTVEELGDTFDASRVGPGEYTVTSESLKDAAPAEQAPDEAIPHYSSETAIEELRAAPDQETLKRSWVAIVEDFKPRGAVPTDVEASYLDLNQAFVDARADAYRNKASREKK